jgi:hypothetical protein
MAVLIFRGTQHSHYVHGTTMATTILYFGCYEPLAAVRKILVEEAGGNVICTTDMVEAVRLAGEEYVALLVVCNSCDNNQYARLVDLLRLCWRPVPILRLDEELSAASENPTLIISLIRAALPQGRDLEMIKKPPQSVQPSTLRKCKP